MIKPLAQKHIETPEKQGLFSRPRDYEYRPARYSSRPAGSFRFSRTELIHLLIGTVLVLLVGLTFRFSLLFTMPAWAILVLAGLFSISFIFHELAHKFSAQVYGLWAEFRLSPMGAILTLISAIPLTFFKIIAPGAVMISGTSDLRIIGRIAWAGPLTNIVLSTLFFGGLLISPLVSPISTTVGMILSWVAGINAFIALFNLIPFSIFDGQKIFSWSKGVWGATITVAVVLLALNYIL